MIWKKTEIRTIIWTVLLIKNGGQIFSYITHMIYQRPFSQQWRAIQRGTKGLLEQSQLHPSSIYWFCNDHFPRALHWSLLGWSLHSPFKHKLYLLVFIQFSKHYIYNSFPIYCFHLSRFPPLTKLRHWYCYTKSSKLSLMSNRSSL